MVNSEVIIQTIKKMLDSGIDVSVIKSALKDLGLNEGEIDSYFAQAKSGSEGQGEEEIELGEEEKDSIAQKASEKIKEHLDERNEEEDLLHASTHLRLDEHAEKLDDLHSKMDLVHSKISSMQKEGFDVEDFLLKMDAFKRELSELKADVSEIKALTSSVQQLMKKVLETQREILTKRK